jgi:hypothetical protein
MKTSKRPLDYILCGATAKEFEFGVRRSRFVFRTPIQGQGIHVLDHHGVSAFVRQTASVVENISSHRVLLKTLRYLHHSAEHVNLVVRRLSGKPILGFITRYFMRPQLTYVQALITMLETDLKKSEIYQSKKIKGAG